ncbi:cell division protein FtsA [Terrihabitans rhizophilus]|jgi:cell division protein FtsA|uniref:Cell division protein FtsA n=1 Tax=Terrihabitans rhizophilus TaxID=3092662 RepID=A0ABU4RL73_9HYPH|nr:cell division protein FtsA [Terrihabitans sp. PJ23]MDX6805589.1 cell division protein FtsA [Terrihabitans sp. PJ23]
MKHHPHGVTPRLKPLPPKRAVEISVLDVGTSKISCLIGRLKPVESGPALPSRTHRIEVLGIGHQRSRGIKGGAVVDMEAAEQSIRLAVDAAERMADARIESLIVSISAGRLGSEMFNATVPVHGRAINDGDIQRVLRAGTDHSVRRDRSILHSIPVGFGLDATRGIHDPRGMVGSELGLDMHVVTADEAMVRNLMLCIERCHLDVQTLVAAPYASGLAALADDEAEIGVTLIDMGAGTTSVAVFSGGNFVHVDGIALGGNHVTLDIARGLSISVDDAERLKTLHGSVFSASSDEREMIQITPVGEDALDHVQQITKAQLLRIVKPRVEETLELVRDRLRASGHVASGGKRVVLTGGACQLNGMPDLASSILGRNVRIGRPLGVRGLPEEAKAPSFAAGVGLLVYPQRSGDEHFDTARPTARATGTNGYLSRMGHWLKESF